MKLDEMRMEERDEQPGDCLGDRPAPAPIMAFSFLAGRYHATPWDSHVNEGIVEWPPSPWRILRALLSVWHVKAKEDVSQEVMESLLEKLGASRPIYTLPRMAEAHTRHYMPLYKEGTSAKIFDAFAHVEDEGRLTVSWPGTRLTDEENDALSLLLSRLTYLGRAESWVEAALVDAPGEGLRVVPDVGQSTSEPCDVLRYLVPFSRAEREAWVRTRMERRQREMLEAKRRKALEKGKDVSKLRLTKGDLAKCSEGLPASIFDILEADTNQLLKQGWNRPPCTRWESWLRPREAWSLRRMRRGRSFRGALPTVARFALSSNVLPHITDVLWLSDRIHKTLVDLESGIDVFRGRDEHRRPLKGHRHAHILPEVGRRQHITHVVIYAPQGFDRRARLALDKLGQRLDKQEQRKVWNRDGNDIQLSLITLDRVENVGGLRRERGDIPMFSPATEFVSLTPFVPIRHGKRTKKGLPKLNERGWQIDGPEDELLRRLRERGFPEPLSVERISSVKLGGKEISWLDFVTFRPKKGSRRTMRAGIGFRLVFSEPLVGPLVVGQEAHYGMGLFLPRAALRSHRPAKRIDQRL